MLNYILRQVIAVIIIQTCHCVNRIMENLPINDSFRSFVYNFKYLLDRTCLVILEIVILI